MFFSLIVQIFFNWFSQNVLRQVFHVEQGSQDKISSWTHYLNSQGRLFQFCQPSPGIRVKLHKVFLVSLTCSWDWTCKLQMISTKSFSQPNCLIDWDTCHCRTTQTEFWGHIKLMSPSRFFFVVVVFFFCFFIELFWLGEFFFFFLVHQLLSVINAKSIFIHMSRSISNTSV